ncbi:hypothetical protein DFJ73DRAFT_870679 [Zopfochytrium polystomum]|nr:hypothetical protein DFJ73DRAFT_870679 [Zopfochytrium polystomum]
MGGCPRAVKGGLVLLSVGCANSGGGTVVAGRASGVVWLLLLPLCFSCCGMCACVLRVCVRVCVCVCVFVCVCLLAPPPA